MPEKYFLRLNEEQREKVRASIERNYDDMLHKPSRSAVMWAAQNLQMTPSALFQFLRGINGLGRVAVENLYHFLGDSGLDFLGDYVEAHELRRVHKILSERITRHNYETLPKEEFLRHSEILRRMAEFAVPIDDSKNRRPKMKYKS